MSVELPSSSVAAVSSNITCVKGIEPPTEIPYSSNWPDLFRLTTPNPEDPTAANMDESAGLVDPAVLLAAGVNYRFLDPIGYDYPNRTMEIPWIPLANGTNDATLQQVRDENDYQYADIVIVSAYAAKFYDEHIHAGGDEVRYIIDGSGYFDIRDLNDEWVRMHARAGDFVEFPSGIEHRFAVDESLYVQAIRLFPGSEDPDWSSVPRSEVRGNNTARNDYVDAYLCGEDPDAIDLRGHDHGGEEDGSSNSVEAAAKDEDDSSASRSRQMTLSIISLVAIVGIVLF
mmetsp:Transcript_34435/g.63298  ORF Transcript_34435/g.63298 Transcript_34435/m.63298 type:complete len:286 (+) Transcript_34435:44-901(+)